MSARSHTMRWRAAASLAAALVAWGAGTASGARVEGSAITSTQVIGVESLGSGCPAAYPGGPATPRLLLSGDRGATWSQGPCIDALTHLTSPGPQGLAMVAGSGEVALARPDGSVAHVPVAVPAGAASAYARLVASIPDGSGFYAAVGSTTWVPGGAEQRTDLSRHTWQGQQIPCGDLGSAATGRSVSALHAFGAQGLAAVLVSGDATGSMAGYGARVAVSRDGCTSWASVVDLPADRSLQGVTPAGDLIADLIRPTGPGMHTILGVSVSTDGAAWGPTTLLPLVAGPDGRSVMFDRFSVPSHPGGWPAAPSPTADNRGVPAGDSAVMLDWLNRRFRVPLGLPELRWEAPLQRAAQNHADYVVANGGYGSGSGSVHSEVAGRPGFTGVDHTARIAAAGGYSEDSTEGMSKAAGIPEGVASLTSVPYHAHSFLWASEIGFGAAGRDTVVVNFSRRHSPDFGTSLLGFGAAAFAGQRVDPRAPVNGTEAPVRMWPFEGATDVPTRWGGAENPDPLRNYPGDKWNVGHPVYVWSAVAGAQVSLSGPGGSIALIRPGSTAAEPSPGFDAQTWAQFMPAAALVAGTRYALTVTAAGRVHTTTFTAGDAARPVSAPAPPPRVKLSRLRVTRLPARWRVRFRAAGPGVATVELVRAGRPRKVLRRATTRIRTGVLRQATVHLPRTGVLRPGRYTVRVRMRLADGRTRVISGPVTVPKPRRGR
ncbi:MAG: hypothetical protein AB7I08_08785 [Thermoleophilia bacterium]